MTNTPNNWQAELEIVDPGSGSLETTEKGSHFYRMRGVATRSFDGHTLQQWNLIAFNKVAALIAGTFVRGDKVFVIGTANQLGSRVDVQIFAIYESLDNRDRHIDEADETDSLLNS